MPNLSIIPARAVMDTTITPTQLRVLCAIGMHTNRLGGGVWTSINTLADEAGVSRSTVKRACEELEERGYLLRTERPGTTHLYEVVLDPVQHPVHPDEPGGGSSGRPGGEVIAVTPKRPKRTPPLHEQEARMVLDALWATYPKRPEPHSYPAALKALLPVLQAYPDGETAARIIRAVKRYATHCALNETDPQYVKSMPRFFADEFWKTYDVATVQGRTREEWARSGQDVLEFDRLLEEAR